MKVAWTDAARAQLQSIHDYVAADSASYAKRLVERIIRRSEQLANYPESGAVVLEYGSPEIREVLEGSYRLIYRLRSHRVDVVAIVHGARLLPDAPPE
jgi:plasmid stabilization system protein ParE